MRTRDARIDTWVRIKQDHSQAGVIVARLDSRVRVAPDGPSEPFWAYCRDLELLPLAARLRPTNVVATSATAPSEEIGDALWREPRNDRTEVKSIPVDTIIEVARRFARQHNLCDQVDRALTEMGIELGPKLRFLIELPEMDLIHASAAADWADFSELNPAQQVETLRVVLTSLGPDDQGRTLVRLLRMPAVPQVGGR